jgi:hypothetical protein
MCWACEEEAIWRRYQLEMAVERDEIPPGFTPEDFEWAGLPVPSKRAALAEGEPAPAQRADPAANPFACDAPDDK